MGKRQLAGRGEGGGDCYSQGRGMRPAGADPSKPFIVISQREVHQLAAACVLSFMGVIMGRRASSFDPARSINSRI